MNTQTRSLLFILLLGSAVVLLPACGSKTDVKSENPPETVLNPEGTPVSNGEADLSTGNTSINTYVKGSGVERSYVEKIHRTKGPKSTTTITTTPLASSEGVTTPVPTPVMTTNPTPSMESATPVKRKGGSHWLLWSLVGLVLAGVGWYFWNKSQEGRGPGQPMPPTGGLSPVSGFTAMKDRIEDETVSKPSIWSKKIF